MPSHDSPIPCKPSSKSYHDVNGGLTLKWKHRLLRITISIKKLIKLCLISYLVITSPGKVTQNTIYELDFPSGMLKIHVHANFNSGIPETCIVFREICLACLQNWKQFVHLAFNI